MDSVVHATGLSVRPVPCSLLSDAARLRQCGLAGFSKHLGDGDEVEGE